MVVGGPTDTEALARAFFATYDTPNTATPWDLVEQYRRVQRYKAEHPDKGSSAVANALGLPRGRIRVWVDGDGKPDAKRGLERSKQHGWFDLSWDGPTLRALTIAVWIVSGGSITTHLRRRLR